MPPAAQDASRPGSPFSTTSTRSPCLFSSMASDRPMMPAPMTIASQLFTLYILAASYVRPRTSNAIDSDPHLTNNKALQSTFNRRRTPMSEGEQPHVYHSEPQSNVGKWILIALAVAYVGASSFFIYDQHGKLDKVTQDETASQKQIGDLTKRMQSAEADSETLAQQLGMTKKELAARADDAAASATSGIGAHCGSGSRREERCRRRCREKSDR